MTNLELSNEEQNQLNALLAKKEAAEKFEKEFKSIIESVNHHIESHAKKIADIKASNSLVKETYDKIGSEHLVISITNQKVETSYFPSYLHILPEQQKLVQDYLHLGDVVSASEEVENWKICVKNCSFRVNVFVERQKYSSVSEVKMQLEGPGQYSNPRIKLHSTMKLRVKELVESLNLEKERQNTEKQLIADAVFTTQCLFPAAEVAFSKEYKSGYGRPGHNGYYVNRINVRFPEGLNASYSFNRTKDGLVSIDLAAVNFNILEALKAGNDQVAVIEVLKNLKNNLK